MAKHELAVLSLSRMADALSGVNNHRLEDGWEVVGTFQTTQQGSMVGGTGVTPATYGYALLQRKTPEPRQQCTSCKYSGGPFSTTPNGGVACMLEPVWQTVSGAGCSHHERGV